MARSRLVAILLIGTVVGVSHSASVRAQEPSGFAGRWTLSRELSQVPREIGFGVDWMSTGASGQDSSGSGGRGRRGSRRGGGGALNRRAPGGGEAQTRPPTTARGC